MEQLVCSICWEHNIISKIQTVLVEPHSTAGGDYLASVLGGPRPQAAHEYRCELGHVCGFIMDRGELDIGIISTATICSECGDPIDDDDYDTRHHIDLHEYHAGCCPECSPEGDNT